MENSRQAVKDNRLPDSQRTLPRLRREFNQQAGVSCALHNSLRQLDLTETPPIDKLTPGLG